MTAQEIAIAAETGAQMRSGRDRDARFAAVPRTNSPVSSHMIHALAGNYSTSMIPVAFSTMAAIPG